ncbi:hypothetical protein [Actinomadura parmotrematis]|uniref:Secreted protein n=1 Tax=Actinomadura parmotrematis TaxID=2864039 RepID=A0ABS7FRC5_9ACTN|nr:hypothetical protein [Actinomadura parmotrematis]MBW8482097.1 hypothetical protein [Actinomadura parmotrematis]
MGVGRGLAAVAAALLAVAGGPGAGAARASAEPAASSTGGRVRITDIPALGQNGFTGRGGAVAVGAEGGERRADFNDLTEGTGDYLSFTGPTGAVYGEPLGPVREAVSDPGAVAAKLNPNGRALVVLPEVYTRARCAPPEAPLTRNAVARASVAGHRVGAGTTRVRAGAAYLGLARVARGELKVRLVQVRRTSPGAAESRVEVTVSGALYDRKGKRLYKGPLMKLTAADVRVRC